MIIFLLIGQIEPEATSATSAMGFNRVAVENFYQLLGEKYDALHLTPDTIYNCDEIGISVVLKTTSKIITLKRRKQVGSLSSADRGQTVTVEICFNALGPACLYSLFARNSI